MTFLVVGFLAAKGEQQLGWGVGCPGTQKQDAGVREKARVDGRGAPFYTKTSGSDTQVVEY